MYFHGDRSSVFFVFLFREAGACQSFCFASPRLSIFSHTCARACNTSNLSGSGAETTRIGFYTMVFPAFVASKRLERSISISKLASLFPPIGRKPERVRSKLVHFRIGTFSAFGKNSLETPCDPHSRALFSTQYNFRAGLRCFVRL